MKFYQATVGEDFCSQVRKYNIGVELDHFCQASNLVGDGFGSSIGEIRHIMKNGNVGAEAMVLHAPFNELHPAAIDPEALQLAKKRMSQSYNICTELGIKKMVVHSGYLPFVYFKSWHMDRSVEFWNEFMVDKPEDFTLCIENVLEDEPYMMAELMEGLKKNSGAADGKDDLAGLGKNGSNGIDAGRIGICLDVGHAGVMSNVPITEWIEVLAPYIRHFHLHNNDGKNDRHLAFGEGVIDMEEVMDKALSLCGEKTTFTDESIECSKSLQWLFERGYIDER